MEHHCHIAVGHLVDSEFLEHADEKVRCPTREAAVLAVGLAMDLLTHRHPDASTGVRITGEDASLQAEVLWGGEGRRFTVAGCLEPTCAN